jgi:uncharacterized protein (DUF934 family)
MPLIRNGRFVADDWLRLEPGATLPWYGKLLLPLDRLLTEGLALSEAGHVLGLELANDADPEAFEHWLGKLALVAIAFPKPADGRGFTLAKRLRRLGFHGELRAVGHLIPDQYALALSCGFDAVEIPQALAERQPETQWRAAKQAMSLSYQAATPAQRNIMTARWAS